MDKMEIEALLENFGFMKDKGHTFKYVKSKGNFLIGVSYTFHRKSVEFIEKDVHTRPDPRDACLPFKPARLTGASITEVVKVTDKEPGDDRFQITVLQYDRTSNLPRTVYATAGTNFHRFMDKLEEALGRAVE